MKYVLLIFISIVLSLPVYSVDKKKIVSLAPNLTEIVFALGLGSDLVGNTDLCDYPEEAKKIFKIGNFSNPSIEKILASKANIILSTDGNPTDKLKFLEAYGIKTLTVRPKVPQDLPLMIRAIALELGVEKKGLELAKQIEDALSVLEKKKANNKSFFMALQFNPFYSVSEDTWLGGLFKLSGLKNVVGKSKIKYPIISNEFLIKNRPEIFLVERVGGKNDEESLRIQNEKISSIFSDDTKNIKVVLIPKDVLVRPGPRIIDGIHFIESL